MPSSQPLLTPNIKPEVLQAIYEALLADCQLTVTYIKRGKKSAVEYRIHPIAVIQRDHVSYLYCRFADYEDLRMLAIHRIKSATMMNEPSMTPADFSIDQVIESGKFGFCEKGLITLEAVLYNREGDILFETPISRDQTLTEQEDGSVRLVATVPHTLQLEWWLLGLGDGVEVIQPEALREKMAATIDKMQSRYR